MNLNKLITDMKTIRALLLAGLLFLCIQAADSQQKSAHNIENERPRIVNIINFIRLLEPRDAKITEEVLYGTVVKQVEIMKIYGLRGTFLLQFDALTDKRYQDLLKSLPAESFEIGAWWEIPQPLVEKAGLKWRGRYPWDWHADVGFSTGYTPAEREKLIDVYMAEFRNIFGYYPKSVGSWFIDIHSLNYMYDKYNIISSCNCKDQSGTDGYTLWGGYWSQAYYPSRINSYMPAQTVENQLPVPIFRMLGSDPVRQYDTGLGKARQGVISLEPVYPRAGGDEKWVNWYFREFVEGACMEFAYVQAGQENSFTWDAMAKGYEIQMPLIARLRDQGKLRVNTLAESGQWFRDRYKVTPATAVTVNNDVEGSDLKTVWFNSRFFRLNLLWEENTLRIRDIHIFDENYKSYYTTGVATSNQASFFTLPFVDGYLWSNQEKRAGLRLKATLDGKEILVKGGDPIINDSIPGILHVSWPLKSILGTLSLTISEREMNVSFEGYQSPVRWYFDMSAADDADLPFEAITRKKIHCRYDRTDYTVKALKGYFSDDNGIFRILPGNNSLSLVFKTGK